ncbi:MAG: hypothetical protein E5V30_13825 [Mesorhizobium sp.]|nr:MAG: hypothetical protein E5V30_13825 [Mesorhizobium sp.]
MQIIDIVNTLFPNGYLDFEAYSAIKSGDGSATAARTRGSLPYLCTDLFAISAVILQRSGAYHHVAPDSHGRHAARTLTVTSEMRKHWVMLGKIWRGERSRDGNPPPDDLLGLWEELWRHRTADVYAPVDTAASAPRWWQPTLALMCIADEAGSGLGFEPPLGAKNSFQARLIDVALRRGIVANDARFSFSTAEPDLVCVLPKSRTPMLGCTLRSLSHNLALLPPRGLARAYWLPYQGSEPEQASSPATRSKAPGQQNSLNCLLVPMPYRMPACAFKGVRNDGERSGWFQIDPEWCPLSDTAHLEKFASGFEEFWRFLLSLIETAELDVGEVHVVVFPEAALSSAVFRELTVRLRETKVELLIAGLFDRTDPQGKACEHGNYAALAAIGSNGLISYRQKHHRWRLERSQIRTYALGASLDPNYGWWEDIDILSRSLDVYVLRGTTTVTTLICEDLARHDPCQELVRGIGPNLVFALLMDGPQLKARWPARYATVLAEDPGSSVLSLTSLGLVERSNATGLQPTNRSIGLWRDDGGDTIELALPPNAHALCLSLHATDFAEYTLDGRSDKETSESWKLSGVQPVTAPSDTKGLKDVLAGKWPVPARD